MKKKTVLIFWIIGFIIALIGASMFVPAIVAAANHCTTNQFGRPDCSLPTNDLLTSIGLIGVIVLLIGAVFSAVAWIGALVRSAKMGTWGWFVIVLIFSGLGTLIYALAGPPERLAMMRSDSPYASPH
ncbi:MAG: hypothetical protein ABI234_01020 [Ktedonobacteraceae bacterium]